MQIPQMVVRSISFSGLVYGCYRGVGSKQRNDKKSRVGGICLNT